MTTQATGSHRDDSDIEIWVYTIVLSSTDIVPIYKSIRRACKGHDLPMYLALEGGKLQGCYYLIGTPITFTPDHMKELLESKNERCAQYFKATVCKEHFNHHYEITMKNTFGINLGKYTLTESIPIWYGDQTLQETEEYQSLFDDLEHV